MFPTNQFVNNFMKMRQQLATTSATASDSKQSKQLGTLPTVGAVEVSLKSLIDKKPADKIVKEYFQKRIEDLEAD